MAERPGQDEFDMTCVGTFVLLFFLSGLIM